MLLPVENYARLEQRAPRARQPRARRTARSKADAPDRRLPIRGMTPAAAAAEFFVLRNPLLPVERLFDWSSGSA